MHMDISNTTALFLRVGCEPCHPDCLPERGNTFPTGHYFSCTPRELLVLLISCPRLLFVKILLEHSGCRTQYKYIKTTNVSAIN